MKILNQGFDHVEFVLDKLETHLNTWQRFGFEKIGEAVSVDQGKRSVVMAQGKTRLVLTQYDGSKAAHAQPGYTFLKSHMDGITVIALEVDDAKNAYAETIAKGARSALAPVVNETLEGSVCIAEIYTPEDVRYRFVQRKSAADESKPALFLPGLRVDRLKSPSPMGIQRIDHLTNNIDMGEFDTWVNYYKNIFGFHSIRHFEISTGKTGLISEAMSSPCGKIKVPINEATEAESQVQEFVERFKGAGVQHLAFEVTDLIASLQLFKERGFKFLSVPSTYYEVVPTRVPGVTEDLKVLEKHGILLDSEGEGYLMQIFTEELIGPFFLEFIQRKGNNGFGEGNFRALFEAIERDQVKRGKL